MIAFPKIYHPFFNEEQIKKVWEKALIIEDRDPELYRLDNCGALIKNEFYSKKLKALSLGWEIDLIKPLSIGGTIELCNLQPLQWENKKTKAESYPFWKCVVSFDNKGNYYLTSQ